MLSKVPAGVYLVREGSSKVTIYVLSIHFNMRRYTIINRIQSFSNISTITKAYGI